MVLDRRSPHASQLGVQPRSPHKACVVNLGLLLGRAERGSVEMPLSTIKKQKPLWKWTIGQGQHHLVSYI